MAANHSITFEILGRLDGSLLSALRSAADNMKNLGNLSKSVNANTLKYANSLNGLKQRLKEIEQYRALEAKALENHRRQSAEKDNSARLNGNYKSELANLAKMRQTLANLQENYSSNKREKGTNSDWARDMRDKIRSAKQEIREQEALLKNIQREYDRSQSSVRKLSETLRAQHSQLATMGKSGNFSAANEARLREEINLTTQALEREIAALQQRAQIQNNFTRSSQDLSNAYSNFQNSLQTADQLTSPFKDAAQNAMSFEFAMSKVKSLTQMRNIREGNFAQVEAEMAALTAKAEHLGATTEFTSQQVAEAMSYFGMAGWTQPQIIAAMNSTVDLATVIGKNNIPRVADILSDAMTAMGIKSGEGMKLASGKVVDGTKYFTDAFAYAITQANLNEESLFEALKYNAPTSHAAGLSLGETFAMNMVSANAGLKGSMAGTAFRAGWTRMLAPPKQAAKALQEMGMTASDATREVLEAGAALESIGVSADSDLFTKITAAYKHYQTLDKNAKAGFLKSLVGQNALSTWQSIFDKGKIEEIAKIAQEIDSGGVDNWATDTANVMRDNTATSIKILESSLDALQRSAGQALTPAIRSAAEAFAPLVSAAAEWVKANPQVVQAAAGIAAGLAAIVVSAAAVKLAFAGWAFITSSITMVRAALASLGSGALLGGLIGRIAALRTALFGLGGAATLGGWGAMFGAISARAAAAATAIRGFFASLTIGSMASGLSAGITAMATALRGAAVAAMSFAFSPVGVALMAIGLAGLYCYQNWSTVGPVLSQIAGIVTGSLGPAFTQIKAAIESFSSSGGFTALSAAASQLASVVGGTLVQAFAVLLTIAASAISGVIKLLADLVTVITTVGTGISEAFGKIKDGDFSGAFSSLKDAGSKALEDIKTLGLNVVKSVEQGANNVGNVINALHSNLPSGDAVRRHAVNFDADGTAHSAPEISATPETPPIDMTQAQANLDALGASAQPAAESLTQLPASIQPATEALTQLPASVQPATESLTQLPASIQPVNESLAQLPASVQPVNESLAQLPASVQPATTGLLEVGTNAQTASASVQALGTAADGACAGITALGAAADGACAGTSALGSAAGGAAGAVGGLGAAAQAACAQLAAAGANAAASVNAAVAAVPVKSNYSGGIYPRGEFLTTFAEKSPEAAIPLDGSQRAKDLWTQAGQILGLLPQTQPITFTTPPFNPDTPQTKKLPLQRQRIPREFLRTTETMPRYGGDRNSLIVPQMIQPPIIQPQTNSGGLIGDLLGRIFERPQNSETQSSINVTFNVTITGNANKEEVQQGIEGALPRVEDWARQFEAHKHERARRSFA